ncbi:hypothetical protein CVT26_004878, partial [Gymnopilus dilepis]
EDHPDVPPQFFFLFDLGIAWELEEFCTIFFSGLHHHGGMQVRYKAVRLTSRPFLRLIVLGYPQGHVIRGEDVVAFAALPNKVVLPVGKELRDPTLAHPLAQRPHCTQATFAADGLAILTPYSYFRHISRSVVMLVSDILRQAHPSLIPRFDLDLMLASLTAVIEGKRIRAPPWEVGPGWRGADAQPGADIAQLLKDVFDVSEPAQLSVADLSRLWNSDSVDTTHPYANPAITRALNLRSQARREAPRSIPLRSPVLGEPLQREPLGARRGKPPTRPRICRQARGSAGQDHSEQPSTSEATDTASEEDPSSQSEDDTPEMPAPAESSCPEESPGAEPSIEDDSREDSAPAPDGSALEDGLPSGSSPPNSRCSTPADDPACVSPFEDVDSSDSSSSDGARFQRRRTLALDKVEMTAVRNLVSTAERSNTKSTQLTCQASTTALVALIEAPCSADLLKHALEVSRFVQGGAVLSWSNTANIMLMNMLLWEWIEREAVAAFSNSSHPYHPLSVAVREALGGARPCRSLDAADYLPGFERGVSVVKVNPCGGVVDDRVAIDRLIKALAVFLSFPDVVRYRPRAWYTRELLQRCGPQVLLIPSLSKAANNVSANVLGLHKNAVPTPELR